MGKWVHRILGVRPDDKTATCAHCGPVEVYWNGKRWQCRTQLKEKKRGVRKGKKGRHGLTWEEADAMKADASCEVCDSRDRLVVDHDHETMKIRGVLCHWCNVALGMTKDDPDRLRALADYLER